MLSRKIAERPAYDYLIEHGVMELEKSGAPFRKAVFYDSLDAMLMGLISDAAPQHPVSHRKSHG